MLASTSEVYGDPLEHPQREEHSGHVDPIGPERLRRGQALRRAATTAYRNTYGVDTGIVRIFDAYGPDEPRRRPGLPQFVGQALRGDLTVTGDGSQTRSMCFVTDPGRPGGHGRQRHEGPVNMGNPVEVETC